MTERPAAARRRVLVVDDDKLICWALEKELTGLALCARSVETGAEAFSELRTRSYDFLFLDAHLPDSDGIELLPEIGRISPNTKIVVMSCDASEANRRRAIAGGARRFLEKPFDISDIREVMQDAARDCPSRRSQPRRPCRLHVRISDAGPDADDAPGGPWETGGVAVDIHFEGMKLRTERPLRAGQKLRVRIPTGDDPALQLLRPDACAVVVWVVAAEGGFAAGLKFSS